MTTFASPVAPRPSMLRSNRVAEIMTPDPIAFEKDMPIQKAYALLRYHNLDAAPVIDEERRLAGVVTAASCAAWEEFSLRSSPHGFVPTEFDGTPVWEITSPIVERIRDNESIEKAVARLAERRVRRLYVVDRDDELVGVVSRSDLLRQLA